MNDGRSKCIFARKTSRIDWVWHYDGEKLLKKKRKKLLWKKQNKIFKKGNRTSKEQRNERQQKNNNTRTHLLLKNNNNTFFETYITYLLVECNLMGIRMYFQVTKQLKLFFSSCISLSLILTVSILLTSFIV